jgi:hypothetical protein
MLFLPRNKELDFDFYLYWVVGRHRCKTGPVELLNDDGRPCQDWGK